MSRCQMRRIFVWDIQIFKGFFFSLVFISFLFCSIFCNSQPSLMLAFLCSFLFLFIFCFLSFSFTFSFLPLFIFYSFFFFQFLCISIFYKTLFFFSSYQFLFCFAVIIYFLFSYIFIPLLFFLLLSFLSFFLSTICYELHFLFSFSLLSFIFCFLIWLLIISLIPFISTLSDSFILFFFCYDPDLLTCHPSGDQLKQNNQSKDQHQKLENLFSCLSFFCGSNIVGCLASNQCHLFLQILFAALNCIKFPVIFQLNFWLHFQDVDKYRILIHLHTSCLLHFFLFDDFFTFLLCSFLIIFLFSSLFDFCLFLHLTVVFLFHF